MGEYTVKLTAQALNELDGIYGELVSSARGTDAAGALIDRLEKHILTLESVPYRYPERKRGSYAKNGYRNLLADNFTVIYRVEEIKKRVIVIAVQRAEAKT